MAAFEPSQRIREGILSAISADERSRAKRYLAISVTTVAASVIGTFFAARYALGALYQTSTYRYLTLAFTDPDIVLPHWREFLLSLVESVPVFALTVATAALLALAVSARALANVPRRNLDLSFSN